MHPPLPFPGDLDGRVIRWLRHHVGIDDLTATVLDAYPDRLGQWLHARAAVAFEPPHQSPSSRSGATVNYLNSRGNRLRRLVHFQQTHVAWLHGGAADLLDAATTAPDGPLSAAAVYWVTADPYRPVMVDEPVGATGPQLLTSARRPVVFSDTGPTLTQLAVRVPSGRWGPPVPPLPTWKTMRR
ncbi:hypothetical protein [Euzebya pacifica]|uniref:hypothetical protein n=1 Tax=Euzebya pacifica TaxID=1608957 RepID=UPI0030F98F36